MDNFIYSPDKYDEDLFDKNKNVAVINSKEGCGIYHYDYVLCPDGQKRKIYSQEDIDLLQDQWREYCDNNWLNNGKNIFDPESKVKFMLDGIANILLRNHMDGILTGYKEMKIGKYEIPLSVCALLFGDEIYSERPIIDNGETESRVMAIMDEAAKKFDEARAKKLPKKDLVPKKKKEFPPTRRQKIEAVRKKYNVLRFEFVPVDTDNVFRFHGQYYRIPSDNACYAPKRLKDGDMIYDMDQILCAETKEGSTLFFDMDIDVVQGITCIGEQTSFL